MPPPSHSLQDGDAIRPDLDNLIGLRDTTLIALMLCTGIREAELCTLDVVDLRQRLGGELALRVRQGKGDKQRLIPAYMTSI